MNALTKIRNAGFELTLLNENSIQIIPSSKLSDQQREFLRQNKSELIADLRAEKAVNDVFHKVVTCYTPLGNPIDIMANDADHAEFLQKMNPSLGNAT